MENKLYVIPNEKLKSIKKIYIFGDLHGDYFPFSKYLEKIDIEANLTIFLGDYADRGSYGIETVYTVNSLVSRHPKNVLALKGNHEDYQKDGIPVFNPCDLLNEVREKKGSWQKYYQTTFAPFIEKLYLAILLPGEYLFVHGGISTKIKSLDDLRHPSMEVEKDILWSDPIEKSQKYLNREELESFRGLGVLFTQEVTEKILQICGVKKIIRSHQPRIAGEGPYYCHNDQVITVNSTSVYDGKPHVITIDPANAFKLEWEVI